MVAGWFVLGFPPVCFGCPGDPVGTVRGRHLGVVVRDQERLTGSGTAVEGNALHECSSVLDASCIWCGA